MESEKADNIFPANGFDKKKGDFLDAEWCKNDQGRKDTTEAIE